MFLSVVKRVSESVAVGNLFCLRDYIYYIECIVYPEYVLLSN